jgi:hypothetical protein
MNPGGSWRERPGSPEATNKEETTMTVSSNNNLLLVTREDIAVERRSLTIFIRAEGE